MRNSARNAVLFLSSEVSFLEQLPASDCGHTVFRNQLVSLGNCAFVQRNLQDAQREKERKKKKRNKRRFKFSWKLRSYQTDMGMCGFLAAPGRCFVVLGLKLLFLVPAGVPARSGDSALKDNITVRQGDSAVLK